MNEENRNKIDSHSLQADLATGWRPRMKIIGPMPLNFDNPAIDRMLRPLISSDTGLEQVVYLGPRPRDTFEMHSKLVHGYKYKYRHLLSADYEHLKPFFKKFYSQFQPEYKRPYEGMNSAHTSDLAFDSNFESGNLDCAVRIRKNQFDLFLRVDSNTVGHIMWFYFKVANSLPKNRTVKLNIVNIRNSSKNFNQHCLKPYIKRKGQEWAQTASNIKLTVDRISLHRNVSFFCEEDTSGSQYYRRLSFDVQFGPEEEIEIAYSIPYTYSNLLTDIADYRVLAKQNSQICMEIDLKYQTLSGLDIPYLKVYGKEDSQALQKISKKQKKLCVFIIGRQHPGEANGSHVLNGFLKQLLTSRDPSIILLRKHCKFHVIPMLNPDGVVMGNFRTSLYGKDLNRLFKKNQTTMIPEVESIRGLAFDLGKQYKKRMFMFLDFHGHSVRKNAFCYAPGFFETNRLEDIREFPKIIADISDVFRYQSCSFRISQEKKTTARAVFNKFVSLCYTIETSNWVYIPKHQRSPIAFTEQKWNHFGGSLCRSLGYYFDILQQRKIKNDSKNDKSSKTVKDVSSSKKIKKSLHLKTQNQMTSPQFLISRRDLSVSQKLEPIKIRHSYIRNQTIQEPSSPTKLSKRDLDEYKEEKKLQLSKQQEEKPTEQKQQEQEEEDGGEDSDNSDQQDMKPQKFKKYINGAARMFIQFQKAYYGDNYDGKSNIKIDLFKEKKKLTKPNMQQACLRAPSEPKNISIGIQRKVEPIERSERSLKKIEVKNSSYQLNLSKAKKERQAREGTSVSKETVEDQSGRNADNPLMSLPRISVINYLAYDDEKNEKQGPIFRAPKIDNIYLRNNFKRYG